MQTRRLVGVLVFLALIPAGQLFGWSVLEEVTVIDPNLTAELVWELPDSKTYCQSAPPNLDRLACVQPQVDEFWIGVDAAGNRYGTITAVEAMGDFFDIYRRPAGTNLNHHIVRITKRVEPIPTEITKLFSASRWEIDVVNGTILIGLSGQCLDAACIGEPDINDHLALVRITGLPTLIEIAASYELPGSLSFRIPQNPEGLPTGDRFDVYTGDVATLPSLASSLPLDCDVASGAAIGARINVPDPLPEPGLGDARYYVASVQSGLDRRAGRTRVAGTLVGRDATVLPNCSP